MILIRFFQEQEPVVGTGISPSPAAVIRRYYHYGWQTWIFHVPSRFSKLCINGWMKRFTDIPAALMKTIKAV